MPTFELTVDQQIRIAALTSAVSEQRPGNDSLASRVRAMEKYIHGGSVEAL